ncbi:C-X-C motif chemokine 13 [Nothobranchius furzeri]|uniref:C-X-C motif chemokine 13-like n=3 Tax=Nothobranchius TaxID=28779 RepID=A0A9D2XNA8_NOTFU|nr:C-X-C motif chemokine 13 [Nothobranchius furzeri]KAF7205296.1 C-X-C motif chemokine 13-like [Nothobranchius furzeri]
MSKQLIVLAALSLCCCFSILHASSRSGCRCLRTISQPVRHNAVAKIEVTPPSGRCRWTERIIYRKRGPKVCISPDAKWFPEYMKNFDRNDESFHSTPLPFSTTNH